METTNRLSMDDLPDVFKILKGMLWLGILLIVFLSFISQNTSAYLFTLGNALLIAGAFYGVGGLTGFLFGIPKMIQNNHIDSNNLGESESNVAHNDNLVQISDWLTKIIVGVGLTQLNYIAPALYEIGKILGTTILGFDHRGNGDFGTNTSIAIILYFAILGFMMVYTWTRLHFYRVLKLDLIKVINKTKEELDVKATELHKAETESQNAKTELDAIVTTFPDVTQTIKENQIKIRDDEKSENDPHKDKFGGLAERAGRIVSATVRETSYDKELFVVDIEVTSTNPDNPLTGEVTFFLHPSFPSEVETIKVIDGKAVNKLISYGAFTVGVETDNGTIQLELDLSQIPDVPKLFKER
ncbi:hypothetical protein NAT51_02820 [Flavobacterium amniphilum]|uniref:pYEATS domain-containing protein n=1 Tax=Flavobacterium amniphilum TaxID=1834035 RepID=UPI002029BD13|nr:pYEATS domain-containing protein [Flavobacterium amniphilum]MCL9804437.1 hypothetical protein [Flavobacterium amniphilum]